MIMSKEIQANNGAIEAFRQTHIQPDVATQRKALLDLQRDLHDYGYVGEAPLPTAGKTEAQVAALQRGADNDKQRFDAIMGDFIARDTLLVKLQQARQQLFDLGIVTETGQENKAEALRAVRETAGLEKVDGNIRAIMRLNTLITRLQAHQNLHPTPEALKSKEPMTPPPSLFTPPLASSAPAVAVTGPFEARTQDFMAKFAAFERDLARYQTEYHIAQLEALQQRLNQYELHVNRFMNDYHDVSDLSAEQLEQYERILENETLFDEVLRPQVQALYQKAQQELTEFNEEFATFDSKTATAPQIDRFIKRYELLKTNLTIQATYQEKYSQAKQQAFSDTQQKAEAEQTVTAANKAQQLKQLSELGTDQTSTPSLRGQAKMIDAHRRRAVSLPPTQSIPEVDTARAHRPRSQSAPQPRQGQLHGQPRRTGFIADLSRNWPGLARVLENMGRAVGLVARPVVETRAVTVYPPAPQTPNSEVSSDATIVQQDEKLQLTIQHTCWTIQKLAKERESFITAQRNFQHSDATDIGLSIEETLRLLDQLKHDLQQDVSDHKEISPELTHQVEQAVSALDRLKASDELASTPEFSKLLADATDALKPIAAVAKIDMAAKPAGWKEEPVSVSPVTMKQHR